VISGTVTAGLPFPATERRREKWQRLRVRLEQDIYSGRFAKGSALPSLRDLAPRYGTSPPTLRKAVIDLERAGVVELHGRAHRIPRASVIPGQAGILFTAYLPPEETDLWFRAHRTRLHARQGQISKRFPGEPPANRRSMKKFLLHGWRIPPAKRLYLRRNPRVKGENP
jgi:DNA-binding transcriptional MocR family regulator